MSSTPSDNLDSVATRLDQQGRLERLNALLEKVLPTNRFQRSRLGPQRRLRDIDDFLALPLLSKQDLADDFTAHPPYGTNLTNPLESYTRYHQTSGMSGTPLRILDDEPSWNWWGRCWLRVFAEAGVTAHDRLFFAFSFAPSIGFWSSYKAAEMLGALLIPAGGQSSEQRLRMILDSDATVLLCTPSYALRLGEIARTNQLPIRDSSIHTLIHAGEAGASIPSTRLRLQETWGANVIDHAGATEVGAWGYGTGDGRGLYVNEDEFLAEVIDRTSLRPVSSGEQGELVMTAFERAGWPVIRYRTGDIVRPVREHDEQGNPRLLLAGGVLGRADDMIIVRGMNIFPSAIENVIRQTAGVAEFRVTARRRGGMDELEAELEGDAALCQQVQRALRDQMGVRIQVSPVRIGALPRWEAKHKRFVDRREDVENGDSM